MVTDNGSTSSTSQFNANMSSQHFATDYSSLAKTLNFNLPLKLDKTNYIYWKTQVLLAIRSVDLEDYISTSAFVP
ncbi:hypothetical protein ACOSQ2_026852 [Xanthoceras sorbifolium]